MAQITDLATAQQLLLQGKGVATPYITILTGTITASTAASGNMDGGLSSNNIGTTLTGTMRSIPIPATGAPTRMMMNVQDPYNSIHPGFLAFFYKIGTLDLTATGDKFTHDTATFPITRTLYGQATQPLDLIPLVQISTATTTTAAVFTIKNAGNTTGYVNASGSTVVGTNAMTLPAAATKLNTTLLMLLNAGDTGVRDITSINVGTSAAAGAATIWGMEIISPLGAPTASFSMLHDSITGGINLANLQPGAATTGTATSFLGTWGGNSTTTHNTGGFLLAAQDT